MSVQFYGYKNRRMSQRAESDLYSMARRKWRGSISGACMPARVYSRRMSQLAESDLYSMARRMCNILTIGA